MNEQKTPLCPACGKRMVLSRNIKKDYPGYVVHVFECKRCQVFYTVGESENDGV